MNAPTSPSVLAFTGGQAMTPPPSAVETGGNAIAEMARVRTEASYLMAMKYPRDWGFVEQKLLEACSRPSFANSKRTYYIKPVGEDAHGLGIGFAEEAIRTMRNICVDKVATFDCDEFELWKVIVIDLESNIPFMDDVKVTKLVERSRPAADGSYVSKRKNSKGQWTYLVPTTNEDDLLSKRGALVSKSIRVCTLRLLPSHIKEACIDKIFEVRVSLASKDPAAEARRLKVDFVAAGVPYEEVLAYVGKDLEECKPDELVKLRGIFNAIETGESKWVDFFDAAGAGGASDGGPTAAEQRPRRPVARSEAAAGAAATASQPAAAPSPTSAHTSAPAPSEAAAPAPTPAPAPAGPTCSEGMRKFLLRKFASHPPAKLVEALRSVSYTRLSVEHAAAALTACDAQALDGLTEDQFQAAKAKA